VDARFVDEDLSDDDRRVDHADEAAQHAAAVAAAVRAERAAARASAAKAKEEEDAKVRAEQLARMTPKEQMMETVGFIRFGSSKGKRVTSNFEGAARGAAHQPLKREYRQYMHRKGGFNQGLD
jgi:U4/U6.U5 tri-snRNP-associated protein 3